MGHLNKYIILAFITFISCNRNISHNNSYADLLNNHKATDSKQYLKKGEWINRIYNIDEARIDFVTQMNKIDGFSEVPTQSKSLPEMKKHLQNISKKFHPSVKKLFDDYIYGIYFCEKLGGTGLTGYVYNKEKKLPVGGIVFIDATVINKKANDWITYKENSVFIAKQVSLKIEIEEEINNTIENALRYILMHEMGHIVSNTFQIIPDLQSNELNYSNYSFTRDIWINQNTSYYDDEIFPFRSKIIFYATEDKKINLDRDWKMIYPNLLKNRFPTLYSATNADDYFAEIFVSYVHCIIDSKPWKLTLTQEGKELYSVQNGIYFMEKEKNLISQIIFGTTKN